MNRSDMLEEFEAGTIDPAGFGHYQHVQAAYELLRSCPFLEASYRYATALQAITARAGVPEKFHATITLAFLSLIAERMAKTESADFEAFIAENQDLLTGNVLAQWYSAERLSSDLARRQFLLPDEAFGPPITTGPTNRASGVAPQTHASSDAPPGTVV